LGFQVPVFIISKKFGTEITGQFALSSRFVFLPLQLISAAVGQVFLADAAGAWRAGQLPERVTRLFALLNGFAMILLVPLGITAPALFELLFGEKWKVAGKFAFLLTPWLALVLTGSPLSAITVVLHRQRGEFIFQVIHFIARIGSLLVSALQFGPEPAIALFSLSSTFTWFLYHCWVIRLSGAHFPTLFRASLWATLFAIPAIGVAVGVSIYSNSTFNLLLGFAVLGVISATSFYAYMKISRLSLDA
jgi:O-antigen/teichoic acid export membrane protein